MADVPYLLEVASASGDYPELLSNISLRVPVGHVAAS